MTETRQPPWWTSHETSTWDRVKEALRRDWEQTRHDFSRGAGHDLNQDVGDTVKQAVGKATIPSPGTPNPPDTWGDEAAIRYGYGAGISESYRAHTQWDDDLELKLQRDWEGTHPDRPWRDVREAGRFGWMRSQVSHHRKP